MKKINICFIARIEKKYDDAKTFVETSTKGNLLYAKIMVYATSSAYLQRQHVMYVHIQQILK